VIGKMERWNLGMLENWKNRILKFPILPTGDCPLKTAHCQLKTYNLQLTTYDNKRIMN